MLRPIEHKDISRIVAEWDALAPVRHRQISSGNDISYNRVIVPAILRLLESVKPRKVLDVGCGIGALTIRIAESSDVVGIDPSGRSIAFARTYGSNRLALIQDTAESYAQSADGSFDVVVANMVLMDVLSLGDFLRACRMLTSEAGAFVFSITHPCFWPAYYGYADADWFSYEKETIVEGPFRITGDQHNTLVSTHVHRSLESYISALNRAGFLIKTLEEPAPPADVSPEYKARWKSPRYLVGLCC
ncbi:MAG: class I SAM-dependent methyltransferase [Xanthobacteraceae bacterium]|nr:class I SAM-dependent methyltransferase [Xanthobacteraceae bacterium]